MTSITTVSMVEKLEIDGTCRKDYLCSHSCKITLSDGREKEADLSGDEIYAFVYIIGQKKIVGNHSHFNHYKHFEGVALPGKKNTYSRPIPHDILSKIFTN